jgi:hypothetical protein
MAEGAAAGEVLRHGDGVDVGGGVGRVGIDIDELGGGSGGNAATDDPGVEEADGPGAAAGVDQVADHAPTPTSASTATTEPARISRPDGSSKRRGRTGGAGEACSRQASSWSSSRATSSGV